MTPSLIWIGAICALLGVVMGAFGAHALSNQLNPDLIPVYQTAVDYHMWHALGLMGIGLYHPAQPTQKIKVAGAIMLLGLLLFSGSLYILCLTDQRWLGMITPFGGVSFLIAWALFAWAVYHHR